MKILILGADGKLGQLVVSDIVNKFKEGTNEITTLTRKPFKAEGTTNVVGSPMDMDDLEKVAHGQKIIISCLGAGSPDDYQRLAENVANVAQENKALLIWSGGAGTLIQKDGQALVDKDDAFWSKQPAPFKAAVYGQAEALETIQNTDKLKYIYLSPAITLDYERPRHQFKLVATDKAQYNHQGESIEGYATQAEALVELTDSKFNKDYINQRVTVVEK